MNRTLKIILAIFLVVVLIGVAIGFIIWRSQQNNIGRTTMTNDTIGNTPGSNTALPSDNGNQAMNESPVETPASATSTPRDTALRTARLFVERYGSFSKNNNYENVKNLLALMTNRFRTESEKIIAASGAPKPDDEFYGISTRVLSVAMEEYVEGEKAVVKLQTARSETKGNNDPVSFTQDVHLTLLDVEEIWKVDSVNWE